MSSRLLSSVSLGFSWDLRVAAVKQRGGQVLRGTVDPHIPLGGERWLRNNEREVAKQVQHPWLA